jgi:hypothetical protein
MRHFFTGTVFLLLFAFNSIQAQTSLCNGKLGPNLLGAKGTFSQPFITINDRSGADACLDAGTNSYNPLGNVGNALSSCNGVGILTPCSDYNYVATNQAMKNEGTYSILKTIGDANGGNCIWPDWRAQDHTGDGGYFMAVNGAPSSSSSVGRTFYRIRNIPVCPNTNYEFSAWVINILSSTMQSATPGSEPNIAFRVNGVQIATSGTIPYEAVPSWRKVGGTFNSGSNTLVDLEVINNTTVAIGNDLGLDDIYIGVCDTKVGITAPVNACPGIIYPIYGDVNDPTQQYTWYKWQLSTDGGVQFTDITGASQGTYSNGNMNVSYTIGSPAFNMNGNIYRLVVANSQANLNSPECLYNNTHLLIVNESCSSLPITLQEFSGTLTENVASLRWTTIQEIDNEYFTLLRSFDGKHFQPIARIEGAGNSDTRKDYSFTDVSMQPGTQTVFYKLEQTNFNRRSSASSVIRLTKRIVKGIEVYPNPFEGSFNITTPGIRQGRAVLRLLNQTGQLVHQQTITINRNTTTIQINPAVSLQPGIYYAELITDTERHSFRVTKQ